VIAASYGDYIEQLTYLLFLKMAEERGAAVPKGLDWESLKNLSGTALTDHYADILRRLREAGGLLADIFAQATPRFNNPVNLKRIIAMIDEEDWSAMDVDVKGAANSLKLQSTIKIVAFVSDSSAMVAHSSSPSRMKHPSGSSGEALDNARAIACLALCCAASSVLQK
jgi:ribosomal protein L25 (general stress protein Ctc)